MQSKILEPHRLLIFGEDATRGASLREVPAVWVRIPQELSDRGKRWLLDHGYSPAIALEDRPGNPKSNVLNMNTHTHTDN